jgi:hypothetical protein
VFTVSDDADEIRRQMAAIRRELHQDVKEVVATAGAVTDWRRYITSFPWVSLGAAFAAGYLLVPRRSRTAESLADVSSALRAVERTGEQMVGEAMRRDEPAGQRKSLASTALAIVTPLALRAAQGYAMKYLEQWIMQQQTGHAHAVTSPDRYGPRAGTGSGRPVGPRRAGGSGPAG